MGNVLQACNPDDEYQIEAGYLSNDIEQKHFITDEQKHDIKNDEKEAFIDELKNELRNCKDELKIHRQIINDLKNEIERWKERENDLPEENTQTKSSLNEMKKGDDVSESLS
mmetsp:Transcript_36681/g.45315  ORF Transcript_36681/g.45315 Transcript_36681/m.45315 type:complete len:112 (-) Transcript_36681:71-406(-)